MISILRLVAIAVLIAGCTTSTAPSPDGDANGDGSTLPPPSAAPPGLVRNVTFVEHMKWDDCRAWGAAHQWPGGAPHAQQAPGWEPGPRAVTNIQMLGWDCDRISWGEFERGPIYIIVEQHSHQEAPESCQPDPAQIQRPVAMRTLSSIWFSDPEVANYAKDVYGMPAHHSPITETNESTPLGPIVAIQWGLEGQEPNVLEILDYSRTRYSQVAPSDYRTYWYNGTGASYMDISYHNPFGQIYDVRYGHGTFQPPMLLAEWPTEHFFLDEWFGDPSQAEASFARFLDHECLQPVAA